MTKTKTNTTTNSNSLNPVQLVQQLDTLVAERKTWETGSFKKANDELYTILERCFVLYQQLKGNRKLIKQLNAKLADQSISVRENTDLSTKIVRCVFGDCGKRAFTYATVIRAADNYKPEKQSIPAFIAEHGGIEEIRKGAKPGQLSTKEKREKLVEAAEERLTNIAPIMPAIQLADDMQPDNDNGLNMVVVLFVRDDNGMSRPVYSSTSSTIIKSMLAASERDALASAKEATAASAPGKAAKSRAEVIKQTAAA